MITVGGYTLLEWILGCFVALWITVIPFGSFVFVLVMLDRWWTIRKGEAWRLFKIKTKSRG